MEAMPNIRLCSLANTWSENIVIRYETALSGLAISAGSATTVQLIRPPWSSRAAPGEVDACFLVFVKSLFSFISFISFTC